MTIEQDLLHYISTEIVVDGKGALTLEEPMLATGRVDSLGLLQILSYIDTHYGVALLEIGNPAAFESVQSLATAIRGVKSAG